jgi:hypothetical protein
MSVDENELYWLYEMKTPKGCIGEDQVVYIPTTNIPIVITDDAVCAVQQSSNNVSEDLIFTILSDNIFKLFESIHNKEQIKTHVHGNYIYLYFSDEENKTTI